MNFFNDIKVEASNFLQYLKESKLLILILSLFIFFAYGFPLTQFTLSIDEENAMFSEDDYAISVWSEQGRYGISLIKYIFNTIHGNSLTNTFLALVFLLVTALIWAYNFNIVRKVKQKWDTGALIFTLVFLTFPAYAENIGFSMMSFEFGFGWIAIAVSGLFLTRWVLFQKSIYYAVGAIVLNIFAISIYQSFIGVLISSIVMVTLLHVISRDTEDERFSLSELFKVMVKYAVVFALSVIVYKIIEYIFLLFLPPSAYITSFYHWGYYSPAIIIKDLLNYFGRVLSGKMIYGSWVIIPTMFVLLIALILNMYKAIKQKNKKRPFSSIAILIILLAISPFAMPILLGTPLLIRVNLAISIFVACTWLYVYEMLKNKKTVYRAGLVIFILYVGFSQSWAISRLFYGDYNRYQEDVAMAQQVNFRIQELRKDETSQEPVVFLGNYKQVDRVNIIKQEVIGYSFFEWDNINYNRMINFMHSLGYKYVIPTQQQRELAIRNSTNMPVWPLKGSVALKDGLIMVNLSEDAQKYNVTLHKENDLKNKKKIVASTIKLKEGQVDYSSSIYLKENGSSLVLKSSDGDPAFSFTLKKEIKKSDFNYVLFEITSDVEDDIQIFFPADNGQYSEQMSSFISVKKGKNQIYAELPLVDTVLKGFRIDPPASSKITIEKVELIKSE